MPLNVDIATSYILEFVHGLFIITAEFFKILSKNDVATSVGEDLYFFFGFLNWFSQFLSDFIDVVMGNETMMRYSVSIWQKVATNASIFFGDYNGDWGIGYIWKRGYLCIQPTAYCESYGSAITYTALEMIKWFLIATGEIGAKLSSVFM
ncbi:MAG: hypothetical protein QW763_02610 [Archaeoglobaceae archaeon]